MQPPVWIDTHCHLDASEFDADRSTVAARAQQAGLALAVVPAVEVSNFHTVRQLAHELGWVYALGIHPLYVQQADDQSLEALHRALQEQRHDPRLVAVGEIGLDYFVPTLKAEPGRSRQMQFYQAQVELAREFDLPVILHVRRSADALVPALRKARSKGWRRAGIAHAFNGSAQQAQAFIDLGFKLGFGGAVTFEPAQQLRRLAQALPATSIVLETDAPDIPPHWRYVTADKRSQGQPQGRNEPAEVPAIGTVVALLRRMSVEELAAQTTANALAALPRLSAFI